MILYFDTLITNISLGDSKRKDRINALRKKSSCYSQQPRIKIAMYSLLSYSRYRWSDVLIKYELDDNRMYKSFDKFILSLYPNATIIHNRSNTQDDYIKSLELLKKMKGNWIFYAPNNDHPLITSIPNIQSYLDNLLKIAEEWKKKNKYVSIIYSHYTEFINLPKKGTPENMLFGNSTKMLKEDGEVLVYSKLGGEFSSIQIIDKDMMSKWFKSIDLKKERIVRSEDVSTRVKIKKQIIIVPKKEICAHYDGYEHMFNLPNAIKPSQIPPLFIPKGFFESKIKIAYGFTEYKKGWVNINPCAKRYIFESENGTDLKVDLNGLPYFWKQRIKKILINAKVNEQKHKECISKQNKIKDNPWKLESQSMNISSMLFYFNNIKFKSIITTRSWIGRFIKNEKE